MVCTSWTHSLLVLRMTSLCMELETLSKRRTLVELRPSSLGSRDPIEVDADRANCYKVYSYDKCASIIGRL